MTPTVEQLDEAIAFLCTQWGFCNSLQGSQLLADYPNLTPEEFARAVLIAEGMDPRSDATWRRKLVRFYTGRFS